MERRDVLDELQVALRDQMVPGTSNSDINVFSLPIEVTRGLLYRAVNEINRLRRTAGEAGQSFREIKQEIKNGPSV